VFGKCHQWKLSEGVVNICEFLKWLNHHHMQSSVLTVLGRSTGQATLAKFSNGEYTSCTCNLILAISREGERTPYVLLIHEAIHHHI
jgi:hypothetical protein